MGVVTKRPAAFVGGDSYGPYTTTGGGGVPYNATNDNSDASYVTIPAGGGSKVSLEMADFLAAEIPNGAQIRALTPRTGIWSPPNPLVPDCLNVT